jgi:hypothetical protein
VTLDDVFDQLAERNAGLYVDDNGALRYVGVQLLHDDPLRAGIAEHRPLLVELFTCSPSGRCVTDGCYRLKAEEADRCPGPHLLLDREAAA